MTDSPVTHTPKMQAFMEMQKMRRVSVTHDISEEQRAIVIDHKYGRGLICTPKR